MIYGRDLTKPYKTIKHNGITYQTCRDFNHISRYRTLRQVSRASSDKDNEYSRTTMLETVNPFVTKTEVKYHVVTVTEENRLDLIADKELGSATYGWVIAYFNRIEDGYTVSEGQKLIIPMSVTALLSNGEILAPVPATRLNLGEE